MSNTSRQNFLDTVNHKQPEKIVVDFGSTSVTGIHALVVEKLRNYYGLDQKPIKIIEPYQMLGEIDSDLIGAMDIDILGLFGVKNMFGIANTDWKLCRTIWGQEVLLPGKFNFTYNPNGNVLIYPEGDTSVDPCAMMPKSGYFYDAIERQAPIDESTLMIEDNLEEYGLITDDELAFWLKSVDHYEDSDKALIASLGGTALGDVALIPGLGLKKPKGIRSVSEWYLSTLTREEFIKKLFDRQTDIALENLRHFFSVLGNRINVVYICGTDFGTQTSTFCSPEAYNNLWLPYYKKVNDWIHSNTEWKTFKHSCGAIEKLIPNFIESGFDIINPVQINAAGMDPGYLKKNYGDKIVFWGGGVDTQKTFAFGKPQEVKDQVKRQCEILNENGGFVFNTIHNIQANVPFENVIAMLEALKELRS